MYGPFHGGRPSHRHLLRDRPDQELGSRPLFISDGLHVQEDIPVMLGEPERLVQERLRNGQSPWRNPTEKKGKLVWFSPAIGTEALLADVILERVREASHWKTG